jgi:hypothetical protein
LLNEIFQIQAGAQPGCRDPLPYFAQEEGTVSIPATELIGFGHRGPISERRARGMRAKVGIRRLLEGSGVFERPGDSGRIHDLAP